MRDPCLLRGVSDRSLEELPKGLPRLEVNIECLYLQSVMPDGPSNFGRCVVLVILTSLIILIILTAGVISVYL